MCFWSFVVINSPYPDNSIKTHTFGDETNEGVKIREGALWIPWLFQGWNIRGRKEHRMDRRGWIEWGCIVLGRKIRWRNIRGRIVLVPWKKGLVYFIKYLLYGIVWHVKRNEASWFSHELFSWNCERERNQLIWQPFKSTFLLLPHACKISRHRNNVLK